MGMIGFALGTLTWMGVSESVLPLEQNHSILAWAIFHILVLGSAIVGGIFGLQKGARWTGLYN
jgi:hypothetical protein